MKRYFLVVVVAVSALLLTACGPTMHFSPQERAQIKNVKISSNIPMPEMGYYGASQHASSFLIGGVMGAVAGEEAAQKYIHQIQDTMAKNNINIDVMIKNTLAQQIRRKQIFTMNSGKPIDGTFFIRVKSYGLDEKGMLFSKRMKPELQFQVQLVDRHGKRVWADHVTLIKMGNHVKGYRVDQYVNNPALLRKQFQKLITIAVSRLVLKLQR